MMMRILFAAALLAALPWSAGAQVEKQVEVTKAYVPSLESASKLPMTPDMTDTVKLRPEIDYAITPLSLATTLTTRPIRPATVTYWEFNRPLPFYLKAGMGYPLNSVLDFYASTQNPGTGYVVGYVNHEGRYAKIKNNFDVRNNSTQMLNRIGAAAGKYFGRHILEGEISYENRLYHRYGTFLDETVQATYISGARIDFGDANVALRFGDDFQDLSRTNFEVALRGNLFMSYPELFGQSDPDDFFADYVPIDGDGRQMSLAAHGKIARAFGRHRLSAEVGYEHLSGGKALDGSRQQMIHAALRYGIDGGVVRLEAGADYYHNDYEHDQSGAEKGDYIVPFLRLDFELGTPGLRPFAEMDGSVTQNSHRSLTRQNPYVGYGVWLPKSSVDYNGRLGIGGSLWRDKFAYRLYAGFSVRDNHIYWANFSWFEGVVSPFQGRQTALLFNGEATWRPTTNFRAEIAARGFIYNDEDEILQGSKLCNGTPAFEGNASVHYDGRRISFGAGIYLQSERKWTIIGGSVSQAPEYTANADGRNGTFTTPFAADLRVDFEWKVSGRVTLFAQGRNLLNRSLYEFPWYPQYGANFTVGVKANF